ncbi:MAG: hypothetical protein E7Z90_02155 [Cyanobacteria bacterium SIG29]|nr:hypothetical protein [Cyanobacteria bacterium SIG29]
MQVSFSPSVNTMNYSFKSQGASKGTNVLDCVLAGKKIPAITNNVVTPKEKISEKDKFEIQAKRVKTAVGCCLAVVIAADILYFAMKRNIKYSKLKKAAELVAEKSKTARPIPSPPKSLEELVKEGLC